MDSLVEQQQDQFQIAFEQAAIGMAITAPDGRWLQVNAALCALLDYSRDELLATSFKSITHPEDRACDDTLLAKLLADEMSYYEMEKRYRRKDGEALWVHVTVTLVRDDQGEPAYMISQAQDISERKKVEAALRASEAKFRLLAETSTDMISRLDPDGNYLYVSPACRLLLGYEPREMIGRNAYDFFHPDDAERVSQRHEVVTQAHSHATVAYRIRKKDGEYTWFETTSHPVHDQQTGSLLEIHAASRDIAARKKAEERIIDQARQLREANTKLSALATTDPLTGLHNRRSFEARLTHELRRSQRNGSPVSLVLLDVDHFKTYNDTFGHPAGDRVLKGLAALLIEQSRETDLVCRFGGEEFAILLPDTPAEGAMTLAERYRQSVEKEGFAHRDITVSLGVATHVTRRRQRGAIDERCAELIAEADRALYEAKSKGRNRVEGGQLVAD